MLNIGDKIYVLETKYNALSRQKLTMVDDEGNIWYRYDKPTFSYSIKEHTIVGISRVTNEGDVPEESRVNEYYTDRLITVDYYDLVDASIYFVDRQSAEQKLEEKVKALVEQY